MSNCEKKINNISNSNLNSIIEYYLKYKDKFKLGINDAIEYYQPIAGYLYCLFNEMYKYYGDDVKKCGNSENPEKRTLQYTTGYIEPCKIIKISEKYIDKSFAETLLFYYLKEYRIKNNREFFNCNDEIINKAFEEVDKFFKLYPTKEKIINHLLIKENYKKYYNKNTCKIIAEDASSDKKINIRELLDLNYEKFKEQYCKNYVNNKLVFSKIENLFWLEKQLNINRYAVNEIDKNIDTNKIQKILGENMDKIYYLYLDKYNRGKKYIYEQNKKIINKLTSHNKIQKYYVNSLNNICEKLYKISYNYSNIRKCKIYIFCKT